MNMDFSQFHFIRPLWLLLIPAAVLLWLAIKRNSNAGQWQKYMPAEMIAALRMGADQQTTRNSVLMLIASLLLIAALAGPSWTKQPVPTLQNQHAMVVLLDLSPSMMAQDLQPNRLTLARFKLIDILRQQQDRQIALIAYAGGAHTVSPLTDDPRTIEALLPALHPSIIPSSGSNVEAAVELALKLLSDAGAAQGDLLLITDGIANDAISEIESRIPANIRLSILGVASDQPTPIPALGGGFVKSASGEIILAELNENQLQKLANNLGGKYARLASDDSDTSRLIFDGVESLPGIQNKESTFDTWIDMGYWLALLVLPLALLWFRKGVIYLLPLMIIAPFDSQAQSNLDQASQTQSSEVSSAWQKLWSTPDQRATQLMQQKRFSEAANTYKRDDWSAIANYKAGNYAEAAEALSNKDDVTSLYNRANATALAGDLDKAQELYEKVLEKQPDHADAAHNKKVVEEIKKQQQESQSQQGDGEQNQEQDQNQQNEQQSGDQPQQQNQSADQENEQSADSEQQSDQAPEEQQSQSAEQSESESGGSENRGSENKGEKDQQSEQADKDEQGEEQTESETAKPSEQEQESEGSEESQFAAQATDETPLDDASEQWLRSIKDDPSGLLRRKFEHQAKERARKAARTQQPAPTDQRY